MGTPPPDRVPARRPGLALARDPADRRWARALLARAGLRPSRRFGQHFLISPAVLDAAVEAAELAGRERVVEIGAGIGALTVRLARRARDVVAYELDARLAALLRDEVLRGTRNVRVVQGDVLAADPLEGRPDRVVANLPYQITTPVLERLLADERRPPLSVLMVQQEVAERIAGEDRSYLTMFVTAFADVDIVRRVSPRAFVPPPRVASAIVRLRAHAVPRFAPFPAAPFLALVSDAYRHRRKTLVASLGFEAGLARPDALRALSDAGIAPTARPEELDVDGWRRLYAALAARGHRPA